VEDILVVGGMGMILGQNTPSTIGPSTRYKLSGMFDDPLDINRAGSEVCGVRAV